MLNGVAPALPVEFHSGVARVAVARVPAGKLSRLAEVPNCAPSTVICAVTIDRCSRATANALTKKSYATCWVRRRSYSSRKVLVPHAGASTLKL